MNKTCLIILLIFLAGCNSNNVTDPGSNGTGTTGQWQLEAASPNGDSVYSIGNQQYGGGLVDLGILRFSDADSVWLKVKYRGINDPNAPVTSFLKIYNENLPNNTYLDIANINSSSFIQIDTVMPSHKLNNSYYARISASIGTFNAWAQFKALEIYKK